MIKTAPEVDFFRDLFFSQQNNTGPTWISRPNPRDNAPFLSYLVKNFSIVLHGSADSEYPVLEPRTVGQLGNQAKPLLFGAKSLIYSAGQSIEKQFFPGSIHCGSYVFGWRERPPIWWQAISIHEKLLSKIDKIKAIIYICPATEFKKYRYGGTSRVKKWSGGLIVPEGWEWICENKVKPVAKVIVPLIHLSSSISWHTDDDDKAVALLRYLIRLRRLSL